MDKIDKIVKTDRSIGGWNARLSNMEYKIDEIVEGYNEIRENWKELHDKVSELIEEHNKLYKMINDNTRGKSSKHSK